MWGGWRDYIARWATPLKTTDISNADVTFSINFCSYYAQPTIGRIISVASLHLLTALVGGKKRRLFHRKCDHHGEWLEALWRPKHLATQSGGEQHILRQPRWWVVLCAVKQLSSGWVVMATVLACSSTACHPCSCTLAGGRGGGGACMPPFQATHEYKTNKQPLCLYLRSGEMWAHVWVWMERRWALQNEPGASLCLSLERGRTHFHGNRPRQAVVLLFSIASSASKVCERATRWHFFCKCHSCSSADAAAVFNSTDIQSKANCRSALWSQRFNLWVYLCGVTG